MAYQLGAYNNKVRSSYSDPCLRSVDMEWGSSGYRRASYPDDRKPTVYAEDRFALRTSIGQYTLGE